MNLAIALAKSAIAQTSPNPSVGAVIVKDGKLVSTGAHLKAGTNHAEINAINAANKINLEGATLYVTLEPCCHLGKTKACTDAIIKHKIKRVVIATLDKNPLMAGNGVRCLREAGTIVDVGICEEEVNRELYDKFFCYIQTKLPYITLKAGLSLDSKLATGSNESKWITSTESRDDAHFYRYTHDAILVGVNTILNDDPLLNCRLVDITKNPIRIILDTKLQLNDKYQVIKDLESKTIIITGNDYNKKHADILQKYNHVELIHLNDIVIDLKVVLQKLARINITSILVEGGRKVHNSFIQNKLFNELVLYVAPKLIGGLNSPTFFDDIGFSKLKDAIQLKFIEVKLINSDIKIVAKPI